jgi:predicted alpha/beta superfamily hydrolase
MLRWSAVLLFLPALIACGDAPPEARAPSAAANVQVLASERFVMPGLGRERQIRIYLPPGYATSDRRYPVIYLHDGQNLFDDATSYAGEWGVDEALNALAASDGFEAIAVGIDNGGEKRMNELSPWPHERFGAAEGEAYLRFITDVVKPHVDATYRTRPEREATALVGSSMGGLMSHYGLLARPDVFGRIGVLSPSYWFSDAVYAETGRFAPPADTRVVLYAGDDEGDQMVEDMQRMQALLALRLAEGHLRVHVAEGAEHNEAAWRAEFPATVRFLFGLDQAPPSAP